MHPLNCSQSTIAFYPSDQLRCSFMAGKHPMMCTPTISSVLVTKTLIDSGAGLNILSAETFEKLQLSYEHLMPTKPFSGVTEGSTVPIGQVHQPVTFGESKNYHTEIIIFDVAHLHLPYNAILGYPALAKFMVVIHHGSNVLKMPGSGGTITIPCDEKDAVSTLERAYRAAVAECSDDKEDELPREDPHKKKKEPLPTEHLGASDSVPGDGAMPPIAMECALGAILRPGWGLPTGGGVPGMTSEAGASFEHILRKHSRTLPPSSHESFIRPIREIGEAQDVRRGDCPAPPIAVVSTFD
ncbi:hypothetical protein ZWY2020_040788 [Hordeum vulgare]|nr:hypothetical protein ZWY2020_040788 [Hordeum vulgare]